MREQYASRDESRSLISLAAARANKPNFDFSQADIKKPWLSITKSFADYPLERIIPRIDWNPFFIAWELKGRYPSIFEDEHVGETAKSLFGDAQMLLRKIVDEKLFTAKAVFGIYPANSVGDDIEVYADEARAELLTTFHTLRQQTKKRPGQANLALADYVAPKESGLDDYLGAFAVSIHGAERLAKEFESDHDDYNAILSKALADRLAEAFAEHLHELVRKGWWGYVEGEDLSNDDLVKERYRGIRPAPGYPAQPDHTEKPTLFALLKAPENADMHLTESNAMTPAASVSGFYFAHPEARYFGVGKVQQDQVVDYAKRKGMSVSRGRALAGSLSGLRTRSRQNACECLEPRPILSCGLATALNRGTRAARLEIPFRQPKLMIGSVTCSKPRLTPFRITVDAYYKMAEVGLLDAEKRYELIHGIILEMHPKTPQHGYSVKCLSDRLRDSLGETATVFSQSPARLADDSEPQPDILVLKPPKETYREHHPHPEDILLIIEIANMTLQTDRTLKLRLYAGAGIPEYWLLNLQKNQLELYRRPDPDEARYLELRTLSEGEAATFGDAGCGLEWWR